MSYCRWSSDDYMCDVYVYESCDGWVTHVASRRPAYKGTLPAKVDYRGNPGAWVERESEVTRMYHDADIIDIGLSRDGESFLSETPGACADLLKSLSDEGYNVPASAIGMLRKEQGEIDSGREGAP